MILNKVLCQLFLFNLREILSLGGPMHNQCDYSLNFLFAACRSVSSILLEILHEERDTHACSCCRNTSKVSNRQSRAIVSFTTYREHIHRMEGSSIYFFSSVDLSRAQRDEHLTFSKIKPYCQTPYFLELFIEFQRDYDLR